MSRVIFTKLDLKDSDLKVGKKFIRENRVYEITKIDHHNNFIKVHIKLTINPFGYSTDFLVISKV